MEERLQNNVGFFFTGVLIITIIGFYPTYFVHSPGFEGFSWAHHFHAFFALVWIFLLITQAFLIRAKKYSLHRKVGKLSYVVIPILLFSFFLMAKAMYYKSVHIKKLSETDALAELSKSGLRDIVFLAILYGLGMLYKRRTAWHLRFLTCTGLMILGPGLGRFAFVNFSPQVAGLTMAVFLLGVPIVWLIADIVKRKSPIPLLVFISISVMAVYVENSGYTAWWQVFSKWFAGSFF